MTDLLKQVALYYLLGVNLLAFAVSGLDKRAAVKGRRRVPEARLLFLAAAGGGIGLFLSMEFFRHKTQKSAFRIGVPLIILAQLLLFAAFLYLRYYD
ncbi:MAG TPA: DUF1294 domain-containing protein [Clostridiales bacterium]|nr:DUF1294 domain-containing protein [Clostridiales bacterium]